MAAVSAAPGHLQRLHIISQNHPHRHAAAPSESPRPRALHPSYGNQNRQFLVTATSYSTTAVSAASGHFRRLHTKFPNRPHRHVKVLLEIDTCRLSPTERWRPAPPILGDGGLPQHGAHISSIAAPPATTSQSLNLLHRHAKALIGVATPKNTPSL